MSLYRYSGVDPQGERSDLEALAEKVGGKDWIGIVVLVIGPTQAKSAVVVRGHVEADEAVNAIKHAPDMASQTIARFIEEHFEPTSERETH